MNDTIETLGVITEVNETKLVDQTVTNYNGRVYQVIALGDWVEVMFEGDIRFMLANIRHNKRLNVSHILEIHTQ